MNITTGQIGAVCIQRLESIGFQWETKVRSSKDGSMQWRSWESRFQELVDFKNKHGHCRVHHVTEKALWGWAVGQRRAKRTGALHAECIRRLEGIGFYWEL